MPGIINYYTRSAFDQPGGEAKLTAGSHRLLRGSVEQAFRLSDKVGLSYGLSGTTRRRRCEPAVSFASPPGWSKAERVW